MDRLRWEDMNRISHSFSRLIKTDVWKLVSFLRYFVVIRRDHWIGPKWIWLKLAGPSTRWPRMNGLAQNGLAKNGLFRG